MKNEACGGKIIFENIKALDIGLTLDCGQAFRWVQKPNGAWHAVVDGRAVDIEQQGGTITVNGETLFDASLKAVAKDDEISKICPLCISFFNRHIACHCKCCRHDG